jgi:hypothetical protein
VRIGIGADDPVGIDLLQGQFLLGEVLYLLRIADVVVSLESFR